MKITKVHITKFRGFHDQSFELGSQITAIAGQNGTQKSTLLGIITQTFTLKKDDPMRADKPLCGGSYISAFKDKFRLSPNFDKPKQHEWTISFDGGRKDFTVESIARTGEDNIRFWKKGTRKEGDGYISYPTIFLSLKRLVPAAEEADLSTNDSLLTPEECEDFKLLHNKILISQTPISAATALTSKNKQSLGVSTELYDWNQNSMGQDNLGKIILALFSFKRLKMTYPNQYNGGILAIDELDATMYPASQVELLKVLRKYASELNLQILFTTHSLFLLESLNQLMDETKSRPETVNQVKLLYLKKIDSQIKIYDEWNFDNVKLDLQVIAKGPQRERRRVIVYSEDRENVIMTKAILKRRSGCLSFVEVSVSCSELLDLVSRRIPAFCKPNSIVILDGDVVAISGNKRKLKDADNVLLLPGAMSPERMVAKFLFELSDEDSLWSTLNAGYSKQLCFRDITFDQINGTGETGRQLAKKWFQSQFPSWGRGGFKVLNPFLDSISAERDKFIQLFDKLISGYVHD